MQKLPYFQCRDRYAIKGVEVEVVAMTTYGGQLNGCRRVELQSVRDDQRFTAFQWADGTVYRIERVPKV